ncbi:MAG: BspA family leucine-rich repeat surface protein [Flavobacteriaceae bacterium]|nr:BspA family leucine-rich repeat surface protein [Flavobacteriaceae bacterium]
MNFKIRFILILALGLGTIHSSLAQIGSMLRNEEGLAEFVSTWNTNNTSAGSTTNNVVQLPLLTTGGNYAFTVDWGDGTNGVVTNSTLANATHTYASPGIYTIIINGIIDGWQFNDTGDKLKITDVSQWGGLRGAGNGAFHGCANLDVSAIDEMDVSGITDFSNQFRRCNSLTSMIVSDWDLSAGTNFTNQFNFCSSLTSLDVSNWDLSAGTNFTNQFGSCSSLTSLDVSNWDLSAGTNFSDQFNSCSSLTALDVSSWDVSSATNMSNQFSGCSTLTTLDVSNWDVSSVQAFNGQFSRCTNLTTLDVSAWNTASAIWTYQMFFECTSLASLDVSGWDMATVVNMTRMFDDCSSLTTLDVSNWDVGDCRTFNAMFLDCSGLQGQLDVSNWDVSSAQNMRQFMDGTGMTNAVYNATLINWSTLLSTPPPPTPSTTFGFVHFGNSQYSAGAPATARATIITTGWTLTDGGQL